METYRVRYNTHRYQDCSDLPKSASRLVKAESPDAAREAVRQLGKAGSRYIGLVFDAEVAVAPKYGVFLWTPSNLYGEASAVKVFASEKCARAYASQLNKSRSGDYVVRTIS